MIDNNLNNNDMNLKLILAGAVMTLPMMINASGQAKGIELANLDKTTSPREDFYQFACGGWMAAHPLTPEYSRYGTFDMLRENAREQLKDLITNLAENPDSKVNGTIAQKVSDLYALGMDSIRLNKEGAAPLMPQINRINSANKEDLTELIAWMHNGISSVFFSTGVGADAKNSSMNIMHIGEAGLGLGDRDYYLEDNETNRKILAAYEVYIKRLMELIGYDKAAQQRVFDNVLSIEKEMARFKKSREERRNPQLRYNMLTMKEIETQFPNIAWKEYFKALGIEGLQSANVSSLNYLKEMNAFMPTLSLQQIKDYMVVSAVSNASGLLSDDFSDADFEMYDKVMSGIEEKEPRWKRAMNIPNSMLGEAVGELYVNKYFPEESKAYMKKLIDNLQVALGKHIDNLTWMSPATKAKAREKLATFTVKIGYPDKWKDYSEITIDPTKSYLENVYQASVWYSQDNYKKLGKEVDKDEWHMTPQTVNAYYNPTTNEICFPAGILQPPYFDLNADDAQNYGAIGVVIGHEMTHGFDDSGRQFDKDGNLSDWWTEEDTKAFTELSKVLISQFDAIEVAPGVNANGTFTLGENIADQGGLRVALTAYLDSMQGKEMKDIDGLSAIQRFYLAYANLWAGNIREEEILNRTKTDPHSLGKLRVNATLKNIVEFYNAFGIKEGDKMWMPEAERVIIW